MFATFLAILKDCGIIEGDTLYLHAGINWFGGSPSTARALIDALLDAVGATGTVCMPSMPWSIRNSPGPLSPSIDLRRAPSSVGLVSEMFRRRRGVRRSTSYYAPIAALGYRADEFIRGQERIINPFGPNSSFWQLKDANAKALGVGVTLNTSSLAHLPDFVLQEQYPFSVFPEAVIEGEVIDMEGQAHQVRNKVFNPELLGRFRPSATFRHSSILREQLAFVSWQEAFIYAYPAKLYFDEAVTIGRSRLASGALPPWYDEPAWVPG